MMRLYLYDAHGIASKAARDAVNSFSEGLQRKILLSLIRRMLNQVEINPKEIRRKVAEMVYKNGGYCF